jgi:hypothetical protein
VVIDIFEGCTCQIVVPVSVKISKLGTDVFFFVGRTDLFLFFIIFVMNLRQWMVKIFDGNCSIIRDKVLIAAIV